MFGLGECCECWSEGELGRCPWHQLTSDSVDRVKEVITRRIEAVGEAAHIGIRTTKVGNTRTHIDQKKPPRCPARARGMSKCPGYVVSRGCCLGRRVRGGEEYKGIGDSARGL